MYEYISQILALGIILSVFIEGFTEIVKGVFSYTDSSGVVVRYVHPRLISAVIGLVLGILSYYILHDVDIVVCIVSGLLSGVLPAPILHDIGGILRELKSKLRRIQE